jgi:hypothetical protein
VFFYLGSARPGWLGETNASLFVSHQTLGPRVSLPRARAPWALDSGAFTQIKDYGEFLTTPREYATNVRRIREQVGKMQWAAPQDWMCEAPMLEKTGLTLREHQRRTVQSLIELRSIAPDVPWCPVLQGWTLDDYLRCRDLYASRGVDLTCEPIVGIGSVCRRQATNEIGAIVTRIARERIRLHGFGVKTGGLQLYGRALVSSDSMAWSAKARRFSFETGRASIAGHERPGRGRPLGHASCSNCLEYALLWRASLLDTGLIDTRLPSMARRCGATPSRASRRAPASPPPERATRAAGRELSPWEAAQVVVSRGR